MSAVYKEYWQRESEKDVFIKCFLFLLNPILGLAASLFRLKTKSSLVVIFLFSIVFGLSFSVPRGNQYNFGLDGSAYRQRFEESVGQSKQSFVNEFRSYVSFEGKPDFYSDAVYYLVTRVSDNYHFFFMVAAVVYAFFMLGALKIFVGDENFKPTLSGFILLYLFTASQIFNINAFRFFTALWVAVYALLEIFICRKEKYWILLFLTPFFHGSFFILYPISCLYLLFGKRIKFLSILLVASVLFSSFSVQLVDFALSLMPDSLAGKYIAYINEDYMYEINQAGNSGAQARRFIEFCMRMYFNFMLLYAAWNYKRRIEGTTCDRLLRFSLILMSVVNFTFVIPSLGVRFLTMTFPFIAYIWTVCFNEQRYLKYVYILSAVIAITLLFPFQLLKFPCYHYYSMVLPSEFYYTSPVYMAFKYLIFN